jgi:CRISPR-associated protein Csd2
LKFTEKHKRAAENFNKICALYEPIDHRHASDILVSAFPDEAAELFDALLEFRITDTDIKTPGGSESPIPKKIKESLGPMGWKPGRLTAQQVVTVDGKEIETYPDTHEIDYLKGRVAFDIEWNSKDQTFDRDLYAFRMFFDLNRISVAVLLTRSDELEDYFKTLGDLIDKYGTTRAIKAKYGASTTHMGQLIWRLDQGRGGGCPILALGITKKLISSGR